MRVYDLIRKLSEYPADAEVRGVKISRDKFRTKDATPVGFVTYDTSRAGYGPSAEPRQPIIVIEATPKK